MKLRNQFKLMLAMTIMGSGLAQAALIDRGGGMIYDDVLDVTWLQDANYAKTSGYNADGKMTFNEASAWVQNLSYGGYNDWRLPEAKPVIGSKYDFRYSAEGLTDFGYNNISKKNELAYMYYINLNNDGKMDVNDNPTGCEPDCLSNTGIFENIQPDIYWSGEVIMAADPIVIMGVDYSIGHLGTYRPDTRRSVWAVRSGDVAPVPVPAAVWLFGSALMGLVSVSRKKKNIL